MENEIQIDNCCYICGNRAFQIEGICCGLTQYLVDYADCCDDFVMDEAAKKEMSTHIRNKEFEEKVWENMSDFDKFLYRHTFFGKMNFLNKLNEGERED